MLQVQVDSGNDLTTSFAQAPAYNAKASLQRMFWFTVVLNLGLFAWLWRSGVAGTWTAWVLG